MSDVLFEHRIVGNWVRLYANRLEFQMGAPLGKVQTILLRNVTEVETGFARNMSVHTSDGQRHTLPISGKAAADLKARVMDLL